jgi:hypothetical protein
VSCKRLRDSFSALPSLLSFRRGSANSRGLCAPNLYRGGLLVISFLITGCHGDVDWRLDVKSENSAVVTLKEVLDDQMYALVLSQSKSDPFQAPSSDWQVSRSVDDNGNHVFVATSPTMPLDQALGGFETYANSINHDSSDDTFTFPSPVVHGSPFVRTIDLDGDFPALMKPDPSNSYSAMTANIAASVFAVHFDLRTPGNVTATNGERTPDGFTRWDLNLSAPTHIEYSVRIVSWPLVIGLSLAALSLIVVVLVSLRRRSTAEPISIAD